MLDDQGYALLIERVMPHGTGTGTFGARYAKLEFTPAWDNMWRVGDHPDVVVDFDWIDEYYYIYPDAAMVRYQEIHANL